METELTRIAEKAKQNPKLKFNTLVHLINEQTLMAAHKAMPKHKASGVDGIGKNRIPKEHWSQPKRPGSQDEKAGPQTANRQEDLHIGGNNMLPW